MARRPRNAGQLDERDAGRAAVTGREPSAVGVPRWAGMPCAMRAGAESLLPGPGMSAQMMIAAPGAGVSAPSAAGRSSGPAVLVCPVTIRARVWGLPSDLRAIPDPARSGASVRMGWARRMSGYSKAGGWGTNQAGHSSGCFTGRAGVRWRGSAIWRGCSGSGQARCAALRCPPQRGRTCSSALECRSGALNGMNFCTGQKLLR